MCRRPSTVRAERRPRPARTDPRECSTARPRFRRHAGPDGCRRRTTSPARSRAVEYDVGRPEPWRAAVWITQKIERAVHRTVHRVVGVAVDVIEERALPAVTLATANRRAAPVRRHPSRTGCSNGPCRGDLPPRLHRVRRVPVRMEVQRQPPDITDRRPTISRRPRRCCAVPRHAPDGPWPRIAAPSLCERRPVLRQDPSPGRRYAAGSVCAGEIRPLRSGGADRVGGVEAGGAGGR